MTLTVLFMWHKFSAHTAANFPEVTRETKLSAIQRPSVFCWSYCIFSSRVAVIVFF